ncbi:MAG: tetraacyldisaccharide 4'-kinase, partial [Candidatus Cloacimonetes bacterium]|nr:tetraacyldisaccharide 4'-kinase [Candidatus Cloacimonadota bacterium]
MKLQNFIEKHLYHRSLISYLLYPISLKYGFFQWLRRKVYEHFPSLSYQSKIKIISVGNIVSGGSGKTPFTIFLAKHLSEKGYNIAVSHRGYKGKFENRNKLISDENVVLDFAKEAGDEAFLLAQKLEHIPVIVGKNRQLSIKILEKEAPDIYDLEY